MKKILISVLIVLLLVLSYFALMKGIGFLKIKSINDIKNASNQLENDFNEANELSSKTYPSEVEALESAIKQLKISKQEYDNKNLYIGEENSIGTVEIKTYKIHYLWTILGNYRKDRGVQSLTLDLKSTENKDVYDLEFTLIGSYTRITDFLYDIENDEELNFEIKDFVISSAVEAATQTGNTNQNSNTNKETDTDENTTLDNNTEQTNNNSQSNQDEQQNTTNKVSNDGNTLQAKFTVEDIGITLD